MAEYPLPNRPGPYKSSERAVPGGLHGSPSISLWSRLAKCSHFAPDGLPCFDERLDSRFPAPPAPADPFAGRRARSHETTEPRRSAPNFNRVPPSECLKRRACAKVGRSAALLLKTCRTDPSWDESQQNCSFGVPVWHSWSFNTAGTRKLVPSGQGLCPQLPGSPGAVDGSTAPGLCRAKLGPRPQPIPMPRCPCPRRRTAPPAGFA